MKRKRRIRQSESTRSAHKIVAYQIYRDETAPVVPAAREREWMNNEESNFAYRCLPLTMANQYGWEVLFTRHVRATWNGRSHSRDVRIKGHGDSKGVGCHSHFGCGILTFSLPFLFRTAPGWNLWVRGPTNRPKDGLMALDGIVETDWAHSTFTMNWRFTRACTVEFDVGEPICQIFPIKRDTIESFSLQIRMLRSVPELQKKYLKWSASRKTFIRQLRKKEEKAVRQGWQKDYIKEAFQTKPSVCPVVAFNGAGGSR
jgi:hypothetical protein